MKTRLAVLFAGFAGVVGIAQNPPAPTVDRVGFPSGYQSWQLLYTFDRPDNPQVRIVYGNANAAQVTRATSHNLPYGSILVMEIWPALRNTAGAVALDENGRQQKDPAATPQIFVSRKEIGFGADYGPNRTGEWEYVAYRPDGTYITAPANSFTCAQCHLTMGPEADWTSRVSGLFLKGGSGAVPTVSMKAYKYLPETVRVKARTMLHFYNDDTVDHTVTTPDGTGNSGRLRYGQSFNFRIDGPGEYDFRCTLHPNMRMKVVVE